MTQKNQPNGSNQHRIWKTEYVEVIIPGGQSTERLQLPDFHNLRNVHLLGIEILTDQNFLNVPAQGINGNIVWPVATSASCWLTLQLYNGKQFVNQRPTQMFWNNPLLPANNTQARDFVGQKVNWPKSYFDFSPAFTPAQDNVIPMVIYYRDIASVEEKDFSFEFNKKA